MRESQKILANILGKEDLVLTERNTSTASFTPSTRTITMPTWVSLKYNDDVFNMFLGHEVGHALYTSQDMLESIPKHIPHSYVNVIEDVRIEKKIKKDYMGLIPVFKRAYKNINDDFFKYFDEKDASFIDRINVFFKCGHLYNIKFTEGEQQIVNELYSIETFEDVLYYANLIKKEHDDNKNDNAENDIEFTFAEKEDLTESSEDAESETASEDESEDDIESDGDDSDEEGNNAEGNNAEGETTKEESEDEVNDSTSTSNSETDEDTEEEVNEDDYVVDTLKDSEEFMKDECSKLGKIYAPKRSIETERTPTEFLKSFKEQYASLSNNTSYDEVLTLFQDTTFYKNYMADCKKDAQIMYNVFNRKKSAEESKRAGSAKSGVIDVNSLYKYKTDDNIFMNKVISAVGKNHGVVIMLDASGSMCNIMSDVLKQVITVCLFCKKAKIPFEVINYAEDVYRTFSSSLNEKEFNEFATLLTCVLMPNWALREEVGIAVHRDKKFKHDVNSFSDISNQMMSRRSTRTFDALYSAYNIAQQLKRKHNISIMNTMLFTDGTSSGMRLKELDDAETKFSTYSFDLKTDSKIMLRLGKKDKLVDISKYKSQYSRVSISKYADLVLTNVMYEEFKKLGNMIYVYCPSYGNSSLYKHVASFLNNQLANSFTRQYSGYYEFSQVKEILGKKVISDFKNDGVVSVGEYYTSIDECFVISPKVFNRSSKYDTMVSDGKFDMEKDTHIVNAINAKSSELKQRKVLANIFATAIATKL